MLTTCPALYRTVVAAENLDSLKDAMLARWGDMVLIFDWYCINGISDPFSMTIGSWGMMMQDCLIAGM